MPLFYSAIQYLWCCITRRGHRWWRRLAGHHQSGQKNTFHRVVPEWSSDTSVSLTAAQLHLTDSNWLTDSLSHTESQWLPDLHWLTLTQWLTLTRTDLHWLTLIFWLTLWFIEEKNRALTFFIRSLLRKEQSANAFTVLKVPGEYTWH